MTTTSKFDVKALMADLENLPEKGSNTKQCSFLKLFEDAGPEGQEAILATIRSARHADQAIAKVLNDRGAHISSSTVRKHRLDQCSACQRAGISYAVA